MTSADLRLLQTYAQTRDATVFSELVRTYGDMVYGTCLRILKNVAEAEDASQECFLRLARDSAKIHTSLGAWLHRSATNECISRIRQSTAAAVRERTYEIERQQDRRASSTWGEISDQVDHALEELPDDLRHLLVAHFLQRRSQSELALELGVSPATMSRRINDGVNIIRKRLSRTGFVLSAIAFSVVLMEQSASAAPATLVSSLGRMAIIGPPVAPTLQGQFLRIARSKVTKVAAAVALVVGGIRLLPLAHTESPALASPMAHYRFIPTPSEKLPVTPTWQNATASSSTREDFQIPLPACPQ